MLGKILNSLVVMVVIFLVVVFVVRYFSQGGEAVSSESATTTQIVYDVVELKTQKDFALVGEPMFKGSGFEPGFNFKLTVSGSKFGVDMVSKYGESRYVGYLDLLAQSTSTKTFSGKMLDQNDKMVDAMFVIETKTCYEPSGDETPYTVDIKVSDEILNGCVKMETK